MKTKLSEIANLAEVIAAIAIVISLFFVGIQLRDNTKATKSASAIAASSETAQWYAQLGFDGGNAVLFRDFITDPDTVTPEEQYRAIMMLHSINLIFQNNYYLVKAGTLDPRIQDSITRSIIIIKDSLGWKYYWQQRRSIFLPEYQNYVDELVGSNLSQDATSLYQNGEEKKN
jgi:hypothetical protein